MSATDSGSLPAASAPNEARGAAPSSRPAAERLSQLPPAEKAARLASQLLDPDDLEFVKALREVGLARELDGEELLRIATAVGEGHGIPRQIDMLEAYFAADGDASRARQRRLGDRFFLQRADHATTAAGLVSKLAELAPECGKIALERIGGGNDGPLVLRAGEHFAALLDDYEETLDTDEIDLREIEERRRQGEVTMVTVRGLVRAVNALLDRNGVRQRLIALRSDADREVYVATGVTEAIQLARAGWLDDDDVEEMMELAGW